MINLKEDDEIWWYEDDGMEITHYRCALTDAFQSWYISFKNKLLSLGVTVSRLDSLVFIWHNNDTLEGAYMLMIFCFKDLKRSLKILSSF